jgi:hypothetical protein
LTAIWVKAERALRKVKTIFFIGYSLPPSDVQIRYLFLKSTYHNRRNLKVIVIDAKGKPNTKVEDRYKKLFRRVTYLPIGFEGLVDQFDDLT